MCRGFSLLFFSNRETPVVEKEVVEVDAPKVVDEVEETEVVEKSNGDEAEAASENGKAESTENGTTEATTEEDKSAEEVDVQNGDSTGKFSQQTPPFLSKF